MACDCIEVVDAKLATRNSKLLVGFTFGTEEQLGYSFPCIETEKVEKRSRDKMGVIPTFCPFCGMAYRAGRLTLSHSTIDSPERNGGRG